MKLRILSYIDYFTTNNTTTRAAHASFEMRNTKRNTKRPWRADDADDDNAVTTTMVNKRPRRTHNNTTTPSQAYATAMCPTTWPTEPRKMRGFMLRIVRTIPGIRKQGVSSEAIVNYVEATFRKHNHHFDTKHTTLLYNMLGSRHFTRNGMLYVDNQSSANAKSTATRQRTRARKAARTAREADEINHNTNIAHCQPLQQQVDILDALKLPLDDAYGSFL